MDSGGLGAEDLVRAQCIDHPLLSRAQHLLRQLVEMTEYPEEKNALQKSKLNVPRANRSNDSHHSVGEFVNPHTKPVLGSINVQPQHFNWPPLLHLS